MSIKDLIEKKRLDPALHDAWIVAEMAKSAGAVLRAMRSRAGLTQKKMAAALDISQPRVSQLENGKVENMPPLDLMARYADACGESLVLTTAAEIDSLVSERDALRAIVKSRVEAAASNTPNSNIEKPAGRILEIDFSPGTPAPKTRTE